MLVKISYIQYICWINNIQCIIYYMIYYILSVFHIPYSILYKSQQISPATVKHCCKFYYLCLFNEINHRKLMVHSLKYCFNLLNFLSGWGIVILKLIFCILRMTEKVTRLCSWQRNTFVSALFLRSRLKLKEKIWHKQIFLTVIHTVTGNFSSAFIPDFRHT